MANTEEQGRRKEETDSMTVWWRGEVLDVSQASAGSKNATVR